MKNKTEYVYKASNGRNAPKVVLVVTTKLDAEAEANLRSELAARDCELLPVTERTY